jgi:carbonic anhydrase/SulP family sulfate permease
VIKGLLAAIGVILILKQIPHLVGHDTDPEGEMSFRQPDHETTFSEFGEMVADIQPGAALIGLLSLGVLIVWERVKRLKMSPVPAPLVVVLIGLAVSLLFRRLGGIWVVAPSHLVQVPVVSSLQELTGVLRFPDVSQWTNPAVYGAAFTIAIVASLETLLNLEAVDKLDPQQRTSPPSHELLAQGVGNLLAGLLGAIPVTSVIVRSSVNINSGGQTKLATIVHGVLLLSCVLLMPTWLNEIPLSCLAAILLVTGFKLASPTLLREMWNEGPLQFAPFVITVVAIVLTDLLVGILIGLGIAISFILHSNMRRPLRRVVERHLGGDVLRIELANQVSFLNRAVLERTLRELPSGSHVLLDARDTVYIDPDVLDLLAEFRDRIAPAHGVQVSLLGFRKKYQLEDQIQYVDFSSRDLQAQITPEQVLELFRQGNERFRTGQQLTRDLSRQVTATAEGQFPLAAVLSCIDARTPTEILFDLGVGDVFSIRLAGHVATTEVLGSLEYACAVVGAKLILVMGHSRCGAVTAAVDTLSGVSGQSPGIAAVSSCRHVGSVISLIEPSIGATIGETLQRMSFEDRRAAVDVVARTHVSRVIDTIRAESPALYLHEQQGTIAIRGAFYDVATGTVDFLDDIPDLAGRIGARPANRSATV